MLKRFVSEDPIGLRAGTNLFRYVGDNPIDYRDPSGLLTFTGGGTLRIPGWLKYVIPGFIGQGIGGGIALQVWKNGEFCPDFGIFWTGSAGGEDFGIGKATLDFGIQGGGITDLAGKGIDVSGHWGMWGGTGNFDWDGDFQGIEINFGPGYNVGIAGSMTGSWSIRNGLSTPDKPGPETCGCKRSGLPNN